jgi:ankyrin repeat protein
MSKAEAPSTTSSSGLLKRPRPSSADAIARLQESGSVRSKGGRGATVGYTSCPLCGTYSRKQHVVGRGLAAHLLAVHTPWNPTKLSNKIHRRQREAQEREMQTKKRLQRQQQQQQQQIVEKTHPPDNDDDDEDAERKIPPVVLELQLVELKAYTPTPEQMQDWDEQVLNICRHVEQTHTHTHTHAMIHNDVDRNENSNNNKQGVVATQPETTKITTTGESSSSYRESLPPLLAAASRGDLTELQRLVHQAEQEDALTPLLETRDRHGSVAEHWAAGGGHLPCLAYLLHMKQQQQLPQLPEQQQQRPRKKPRRRDGKTCLHYAARNGHLSCIRYLLEENTKTKTQTQQYSIDERSGEGTTPLHMACYGGHVDAVRYLHAIQGADILATNDWECGAAHWVGMTIQEQENVNQVRELCDYLQQEGVSFTKRQSQGHSALHKAAQRKNRHVVEWMGDSKEKGGAGLSLAGKEACGRPDRGGHIPSEIWKSVG